MGWIIGRGNSFIFRQGGGNKWSSYWATQKLPTGLVLTVLSATSIKVDWTDPVLATADGIKIYFNDVLKDTVAYGVQTSTIAELTADTLYAVNVVAYKGTNNSSAVTSSETTLITSPLSIANCKRWMDFTDETSITKDGSNLISQINDKSATEDHAVASLTARPTWVANQLNGKGVGRFNGSTNVLTTSSINYGANYTVFIVNTNRSAIGGLMGTTTNDSILLHDTYIGIRTSAGMVGGSKYYMKNIYVAAEEPEYSFYTIRSTAGVPVYWERKNKRPFYFVGGSSLGNLVLKDIGGWAAYPYSKDIAEIIIYDRALTDAEILKVQNYISAKTALLSFPTGQVNRISFTGNSFTANFNFYQNKVMSLIDTSSNWIRTRSARGGIKTTQLYPVYNLSYMINQFVQCPVTGNDIVFVWEGTNDIVGGSDAITAEANLNTLCTYYKNAGFKVVIATILPRTAAGFEAVRSAANILIRNNYLNYAHAIADVADDDVMGDDGDQLNLTYYSDGVHPTQAGFERLVTEWIEPAISSLIV